MSDDQIMAALRRLEAGLALLRVELTERLDRLQNAATRQGQGMDKKPAGERTSRRAEQGTPQSDPSVVDGIPSRDDMQRPALAWVMEQPPGGYLSSELKNHLADHFELTAEQLAAGHEGGTPVFANLVDWVTAKFTRWGIHTGFQGRKHRKPTDRYYLTSYGYEVGEGKVPWPTDSDHGPRNALPDPRQLDCSARG